MKAGVRCSAVCLVIVTLSCADNVSTGDTPLSPKPELSEQGTALAVRAPKTPPSTDALFLRLADRIPGGFAGLFVGDDRKLHMWLKDPSQAPAARSELQNFYAGTHREAQAADVVIEHADFSWPELYTWYQQMQDLVWSRGEVVSTDVDEKQNRLRVVVDDDATIRSIEDAVADAGVPLPAVTVSVGERATYLSQSVRDRIRPVVGGLEIEVESEGFCTLTANVKTGLDGEAWGFITAGHCTRFFGRVDGDDAFQDDNGSGNHIGVELADPEFWTGGSCPANKECRWSDAAIFTYDDSVSRDQGIIARTVLNSLTINGSNPEWEIVDDDNGCTTNACQPLVGDIVYKVGRTTGMTKGEVAFTCGNHERSDPSANSMLLCQDEVNSLSSGDPSIADHKDSGAPVFAKTGTSSAVLYGLLWSGGDSDGDGTNDWYLYSRFNLVRMELEGEPGVDDFNAIINPEMQ